MVEALGSVSSFHLESLPEHCRGDQGHHHHPASNPPMMDGPNQSEFQVRKYWNIDLFEVAQILFCEDSWVVRDHLRKKFKNQNDYDDDDFIKCIYWYISYIYCLALIMA